MQRFRLCKTSMIAVKGSQGLNYLFLAVFQMGLFLGFQKMMFKGLLLVKYTVLKVLLFLCLSSFRKHCCQNQVLNLQNLPLCLQNTNTSPVLAQYWKVSSDLSLQACPPLECSTTWR